MAAKPRRHPHAYTLDLMRLAVDRLPPTFSDKKKDGYRAKLTVFLKDPDVDYAEIQSTIAELGRESWPVRKAYEDMFERYGRSSEESFLLLKLDQGVREKY